VPFRISKEKKMTIDTYTVTDDRELERLVASQGDAQGDTRFHAPRAQFADDLDRVTAAPHHDLLELFQKADWNANEFLNMPPADGFL
jgi:hypothetical protein